TSTRTLINSRTTTPLTWPTVRPPRPRPNRFRCPRDEMQMRLFAPKSSRVSSFLVAILSALLGALVHAQSVLSFDLGTVFSGTQLPSRASPWLNATFQDQGGGVVRLTMTVGNLPGTEYVDHWSFNLNPAYNPANLNFALVGSSPTVLASPIAHAAEVFKTSAGGSYDIDFHFSNSNSRGGLDRFTANEVLTYDIGLTGGKLTAADFNNLSTPRGAGSFYVAAQVSGIPPPTPIPEPSGYAVMLSCIAGVIAIRNRRSRFSLRLERSG